MVRTKNANRLVRKALVEEESSESHMEDETNVQKGTQKEPPVEDDEETHSEEEQSAEDDENASEDLADSGGDSGEESKNSEDADEISEPMEPMGMHYEPKDYNKPFKLSAKCYIKEAVDNISTLLRPDELQWFLEHEQFQHFFHMPRDKNHKVMGMWMLILRTAAVDKMKEAWFVVNGVPIRYSIEEHALISGLSCLEYPRSYESLGSLEFVGKHFGVGSTIKYKDIESKFLAMKKYSSDRLKMAVLYFLTSVMIGQRKSGLQATPVEPFLLRAASDLNLCKTFPWGRLTFDANLKDLNHMLGHFKGEVRGAWVFPSFIMSLELLAFEAIPRLRRHFREDVRSVNPDCPRMCKMKFKQCSMKGFPLSELHDKLGTTKNIQSILVPSRREHVFLERLLSEHGWDDVDDTVVDNWTRFLLEKKEQICLKRLFDLDVASRTLQENPAVANAAQEGLVLEDVTNEDVNIENVATENITRENVSTENAWKDALILLENEMKKGFKDILEKIEEIDERVKSVERYVSVCRGDFQFEEIIPDVQFGATEDEQTSLQRQDEQAGVEVEEIEKKNQEEEIEKVIEKEKGKDEEIEKNQEEEIEKVIEKEKGKEEEIEKEKGKEKGAIEKPLKTFVRKRIRDVVVPSPEGEASKRIHTGTIAKLKIIRKGKKGLTCVVPLVRSPIVTRQNKKKDD